MGKNILCKAVVSFVVILTSALPLQAQSLPADTSFTGLFNSIKSEVDAPRMELMLQEMIKKSKGERDQMLVDMSAQNTAIAFAELGNVAKAKYWIVHIKGNDWKLPAISAVVKALSENGKIADAEAIVASIVDTAKGNSEFGLSDSEKSQFRGLYGMILYKKGKYKDALPYLTSGAGRYGEVQELYAMALNRSGNSDQAFAEMNKVMSKASHLGDDFKTEAKALFVKKQGNDKGFKAILDSIDQAQAQKMLAKVEKMKVNEAAPDFEITDFKGNRVSLKSLKGKTVFIDFWATWCVPCVASFPGMQKAVDYYKGDDSVVFMFVHTAEKNGNATEEAKKMIAAKKHSFDVYMDLKDKASGKNPMMSAFKVSMLPTKLVIDPNGVIRYRTAGYIGVDEAIPEIKTMIDMVRKDAVAQ